MAGLKVNNFESDAVWAHTLSYFTLTELFARRFYGKVPFSSERVFFDFDRPVELFENTVALVECFAKSNTLQFARMRAQERRYGNNGNGCWETYAGLHALLFADIFPDSHPVSRWTEECSKNGVERCTHISIGAPSELPFNEGRWVISENATQVLGERIRRPQRSLRLIFGVSERVVYFPKPLEPLLSTATAEQLLHGDVQSNWDALAKTDPCVARDYRVLDKRIGVRQFLEWVRDDEGVATVVNTHGEAKELASVHILLKGGCGQHDIHSLRNRFMEMGVS